MLQLNFLMLAVGITTVWCRSIGDILRKFWILVLNCVACLSSNPYCCPVVPIFRNARGPEDRSSHKSSPDDCMRYPRAFTAPTS